MKIVLAHSDTTYTRHLKIFFLEKGVTDIHIFSNGFPTLKHIIQHRSNIVIIEENLPGLNAEDIKSALIFKHIKPEIITISAFQKIPPSTIIKKIKTQFSLDKLIPNKL
ncbi:MAG: hypothetical protein AAF611_23825 [Bacteroidota bacterium]